VCVLSQRKQMKAEKARVRADTQGLWQAAMHGNLEDAVRFSDQLLANNQDLNTVGWVSANKAT
jgi:hypothetical protein